VENWRGKTGGASRVRKKNAGPDGSAFFFGDAGAFTTSSRSSPSSFRRLSRAATYRDPSEAWTDGVKRRVASGGHTTPPATFARSHVRSRENFLSLAREFGDKVEAHVYENSTGRERREITLDELRGKPRRTEEDLKLEVERAERNAEKEHGRGEQGSSGDPGPPGGGMAQREPGARAADAGTEGARGARDPGRGAVEAGSPAAPPAARSPVGNLTAGELAELEELEARMRKLRGRANSGIDPEFLIVGVRMANLYIKGGIRTFRV
jgi:hypothetical protein